MGNPLTLSLSKRSPNWFGNDLGPKFEARSASLPDWALDHRAAATGSVILLQQTAGQMQHSPKIQASRSTRGPPKLRSWRTTATLGSPLEGQLQRTVDLLVRELNFAFYLAFSPNLGLQRGIESVYAGETNGVVCSSCKASNSNLNRFCCRFSLKDEQTIETLSAF